MATTVPQGAAQGILAFIKAKQTDDNVPNQYKNDKDAFDTANLWHLKVARLGETINATEVQAQAPTSLAPGAIESGAADLASVLTYFTTPQYTSTTPRPAGYTGLLGGKKRHAKTAHKRKQGRSRKIRKSNK
jgi:hypothetical protein